MGAIVAYFDAGGNPGTSPAERQEGGRRFGASLRSITGTNSRDFIYDKIVDALSNNDFKLIYEFKNELGNTQSLEIDGAEQQGADKIILELDRDGPTEGEVILTVRPDRRENLRKGDKAIKKRTFHMSVNLPESQEIDGFSYLTRIAEDVIAIDNNDMSSDYLTAFKLLSRCR